MSPSVTMQTKSEELKRSGSCLDVESMVSFFDVTMAQEACCWLQPAELRTKYEERSTRTRAKISFKSLAVMKQILMRESKIEREQEHAWCVCLAVL